MTLPRRALLGAVAAAGVVPCAARAQGAGGASVVKIGVLNDMSGPYRDVSGPTSAAACARGLG